MNSGISYHVDATNGSSRRLGVKIEIEGPFDGNILELRFPRWVPGSYFIREPIQHMSDLSATCDGEEIKINRIDVDGARVTGVSEASKVVITYRLLAAEMTCRANHLDQSHVHIMPPYTWMMPTRGIDNSRMDQTHKVTLAAPAHADYSGDVIFTLPPTTGTAGQILTTDGYGKSSWKNENTGSLSAGDISVETLVASGNGSLTYDSSQAKFSFAPADTANFVSSGDNITVLTNNAGFVTIQSVFNSFVEGANMTITQDGSGNITFASTGGSGSTPSLDQVLAIGKVSSENISVGGVTATDASYNNQFKNTEVDGTLKVSSLSGNSVVIAGGDGLLSTDTDITYNPTTNTLNVSGPLETQTLTASGVVSGGGLTSTGSGTPNFNFSADVQFNAGSGSRFKFRTGFVNLDQVTSEPSGADSEIGDIIYHSAYSTLGVYVADTDGSSTPGWIYIPSVALKKPPTLPNMTTAERNATTAVPGMIIFNTNTGKAQVYDSSSWQDLF